KQEKGYPKNQVAFQFNLNETYETASPHLTGSPFHELAEGYFAFMSLIAELAGFIVLKKNNGTTKVTKEYKSY
ncbi:hypothetical protein, partial [Aquiflexum sp.]|uniref:hypothetical protein n=1 Tax=Aquiflexum sp. TaxID=1872584 RepID=UPI0035937DE0